jgi:hypothetical protein
MFTAYCPKHQADVLLGNNSIRGLANTDAGIIVLLECSCGERIAQLTGRTHERAAQAA